MLALPVAIDCENACHLCPQSGAPDPTEHAGTGHPSVEGQRWRSSVFISAEPEIQHPAGV